MMRNTVQIARDCCRRVVWRYLRKYDVSYSQRRVCSTEYSSKLMASLHAKIKFNGPITVADYMNEALTHDKEGYYIHRDVFGLKGDFITSPEISQMFGELVAVWFVNEWMQAGAPSNVQIVELGPGRGTMADDMMRAFSKFPELNRAVSWHLVEISQKLSEMQETKLSGNESPQCDTEAGSHPHYKSCVSKYGPSVYWYRDIQSVPAGMSMFVAHEFLDALPIHKFQKTDRGWREIMVDIDPEKEKGLRFVVAPAPTPASTAYLQVSPDETRDHLEVCPGAGVVVSHIADRIARDRGCALIVDYGHTGEKGDTFRGFKDHRLHDVLEEPGSADLTADVDFSQVIRYTQQKVRTVGPVNQSTFLHNMGIGLRLKMLYEKGSPETRDDLLSAYNMLTSPEEMGERFKFLALVSKDSRHDTVGFDPLPEMSEDKGSDKTD